MQQRIPLMAAMAKVERSLAAGKEPAFEPVDPWLRELQAQVERMKSATLFAAMEAAKRYAMEIEEQQAILGSLADMLTAIYAADSAVTRTLQYGQERSQSGFFVDCTTLFTEQARDRTFSLARSVLCSSLEGDELDLALERLATLDHWRPLDLHGIRDRVAAAVIDAAGWPVS